MSKPSQRLIYLLLLIQVNVLYLSSVQGIHITSIQYFKKDKKTNTKVVNSICVNVYETLRKSAAHVIE